MLISDIAIISGGLVLFDALFLKIPVICIPQYLHQKKNALILQEKKLINFISEFHKLDRVIACICSGVQLLISAKIVKGKNISGYYSLKDDIINAGANYVDEPAVIDSKIVTTAHYKDMGPWMKAVLKFFDEKKR